MGTNIERVHNHDGLGSEHHHPHFQRWMSLVLGYRAKPGHGPQLALSLTYFTEEVILTFLLEVPAGVREAKRSQRGIQVERSARSGLWWETDGAC